MNIDFHTHGLVSKRIKFDKELFLLAVEFAKDIGLDGFLISEHFNAIDFDGIHKYLRNNFHYEGDRYLVNGISIFPAMEVNIKNKGHVIISGHRDSIEEIYKMLEPNRDKENFILFSELLDIADDYKLLKIGAHPFRRGQKLVRQDKEDLKRLDFLDLNAKDIYKNGLMAVREEVKLLARDTDLKVISGSDSHYPIQLGSIYTKLNKDCSTVEEIREAVLNDQYEIELTNSFDLRIKAAKYSKRSYVKNLNRFI